MYILIYLGINTYYGDKDMLAVDFHTLYGDVTPLDIFTELVPLDMSLVKDVQYGEEYTGSKTVYRYSSPPPEMNLPDNIVTNKAVRVESNQGSFFLPHRDFIGNGIDGGVERVRLTCFVNNSHPEECSFIVDGKLQHFENRRWYALNPRKTHYSFTLKDNTVHYVVNIDISDETTASWLHNNIKYVGAAYSSSERTMNSSRQGTK
jgi:hypothetical protein